MALRIHTLRHLVLATASLSFAATWDAPRPSVRATGRIRAVHSITILVPRIEGQGGGLTLANLAQNGVMVNVGDPLAIFDRAGELKTMREAQTKLDDLAHQIEEKRAAQRGEAERRNSDLAQANADLRKAEIETRKGPVLSAIETEKNLVRLEDARLHVASLQKSMKFRDTSEEAELHVLELQKQRQQVAVERQNRNSETLTLKAPIKGMVALQNVYRNNSMGHAQEGDQLWPGSPILNLFDPTSMEVEVAVGEPDGAVLVPGAKATVHLDAFPGAIFKAHFVSASPVATSALGMSVKTFSARFRLEATDPRLMPDLSAAVDIEAGK
ncbi:MAG TPA: efflux RND transporter periplasmic adaptor subunit [Bryobacteraceae bacterium]|nr:efflux RND transporter periplasmic adaptor subunit [Bryobacteraceae bacterium]